MYLNECKAKSENENVTNYYRHFLKSNVVGVNRLFVLVDLTRDNDVKRFEDQRYYLPGVIMKNYNLIVNEKIFYDQPSDFDIIRHKEIRNLTIGQGEDYTVGSLPDHKYIKNHYGLIAVDLIRQKELDADPKAIQQTEFVWQLKKLDKYGNTTDTGNYQSMLVLTPLEKIKKSWLKFSQGSVIVLWKMANYEEVRVKLTIT